MRIREKAALWQVRSRWPDWPPYTDPRSNIQFPARAGGLRSRRPPLQGPAQNDIPERGLVLHLAVLVLGARLDDRDLGRRQVEERIDARVQLGLHAHDRVGALPMLGAAGLAPLFPVVTVFERDAEADSERLSRCF